MKISFSLQEELLPSKLPLVKCIIQPWARDRGLLPKQRQPSSVLGVGYLQRQLLFQTSCANFYIPSSINCHSAASALVLKNL